MPRPSASRWRRQRLERTGTGRRLARRERRRPDRRLRLAGPPHRRRRQRARRHLRARSRDRRRAAGERDRDRRRRRWIEPAAATQRRRPLPRVLDRRGEPGRRAASRPPAAQVVRRDRTTGITRWCRTPPTGGPGNGWSGHPTSATTGASSSSSRGPPISSPAPTPTSAAATSTSSTPPTAPSRASASPPPACSSASGQSATPAISGTGRFVAFSSTAPLDAPARGRTDVPAPQRLRARSRWARRSRVSATRGGGVPNGASYYPAISGDGRRVAFVSLATNLEGDARADAAGARSTSTTPTRAGAARSAAARRAAPPTATAGIRR